MRCAAALLAVLLAIPAAAEPASFLIVNPSGRGNQSLAEGFLGDLGAAVRASWPEGAAPELSGRYHVTEADALASIRRQAPLFALVSPGFYLAHRDDLHLVPLLQSVREGESRPVVHLVAKEGRPEPDRARLRIGGQLAGEPAWLMGPVLALPPGATPTFVPASRTLEAVRELHVGVIDAVAMHDAEWRLLQASGKDTGLRIAFTSQPLPEGPVVSLGPPSPAARAAAASLLRLSADEAGRKVLKRMTLKGFREAAASDYAPLAEAFDRARQELSR